MPEEVATPVESPSASPTEILFNRGTLMDLYIGKPTFQKKLRSDDLLVENINQDAIYLGHKYILSKKATATLVTIEGQARRALAVKSLEFPLSGARFVYYQALPEVLDEIGSLREQWNAAVTELIEKYPDLKTEQLAVLDAQCDTLRVHELSKLSGDDRAVKEAALAEWIEKQRIGNRNLYPPVDKLRAMFHFEWRMFKISPLEGTEEMSSLDQASLASAQMQLRQDLQQWVKAASVEMHRTLGEAAANVMGMLSRRDKLNPRNLKPLFDAFEQFKAIDFTGASSFQQVIDQMKTTFGMRDFRGDLDYQMMADRINTSSMESFKQLLSKVGELAVDSVAEEAGIQAIHSVGELKRMIEL